MDPAYTAIWTPCVSPHAVSHGLRKLRGHGKNEQNAEGSNHDKRKKAHMLRPFLRGPIYVVLAEFSASGKVCWKVINRPKTKFLAKDLRRWFGKSWIELLRSATYIKSQDNHMGRYPPWQMRCVYSRRVILEPESVFLERTGTHENRNRNHYSKVEPNQKEISYLLVPVIASPFLPSIPYVDWKPRIDTRNIFCFFGTHFELEPIFSWERELVKNRCCNNAKVEL